MESVSKPRKKKRTSDVVDLERQLSDITEYSVFDYKSERLLEGLFHFDEDVKKLKFKVNDSKSTVAQKVNRVVDKKQFSYCVFDKTYYRYKYCRYDGSLMYFRMSTLIRLYECDYDLFLYVFHKFWSSPFNREEFDPEWRFGYEAFEPPDNNYVPESFWWMSHMHFLILHYMKRKSKKIPMRSQFYYVPQKVMDAIDSIFDIPQDCYVFMPFEEKVEDCYGSWEQDCQTSIDFYFGTTDYCFDSDLTEMMVREANEYYSNGHCVQNTYWFKSIDMDGHKWNNFSHMKEWGNYYWNFYSWEETINDYTEEIWKKKHENTLNHMILSPKFRLKKTVLKKLFSFTGGTWKSVSIKKGS